MDTLRQRARDLRLHPTDAERILWRHLRARQLDGFKFRRQHPIAGYVADFVCIEARLVVEIDGGQHAKDTRYDALRTQRIEAKGYRVLRSWNNDVMSNVEAVVNVILRECHARR